MKLFKIFFLLVIPFSVTAQTTYSLSDVVKGGLANSKSLLLSQAKINLAQSQYAQLKDLVYPSVKASAGYTRLSDLDPFTIQLPGSSEPITLFPVIVNNYSAKLGASEVVFSGFKFKYAMDGAQYLIKATQFDASKDTADIVYNLQNAFYNYYKAIITKQIIEQSINAYNSKLKDLQNLKEAGLATDNDVMKIQLQVSNTQLTEADIDNNIDIVSYNLGVMLGLNNSSPVKIDTSLHFSNVADNGLDYYLTLALANRKELKATQSRSDAAMSNVNLAKASYYPSVTVFADYLYANPNARVIPPKAEFKGTWDAGVSLNFDITGLWTNKTAVNTANIQLLQSQDLMSLQTDNIRMEVNANYLSFIQSKKKIELATTALSQATENYRQTDNKFKSQIVNTTDLLDAQSLLLQAKINLALTKADAEQAYSKLIYSTGTIQY